MKRIALFAALAFLVLAPVANAGSIIWEQDFSTSVIGWFAYGGTITKSTTDTGLVSGSVYTSWGGSGTAFVPYTTSLDIRLDTALITQNDLRFDWSSAINKTNGGFGRDFMFNVGGYSDATDKYFVVSASNNSPGWPKNPNNDPFKVTESGWYTFQNRFYDNGGILAVDMSLLNSTTHQLIHSWTLSTTEDTIPELGKNRYGWFVDSGFANLEIDNATLTSDVPVPEPATMTLLGIGLVGAFRASRRRK